MRLDISIQGKIVLREVIGAAAEYIESERKKLADPDYQHWCFSKNYEGTVYVTATPYEDKTQLMELLDVLFEQYGLTLTEVTRHLLCAWRRDVLTAQEGERTSGLINGFEEQIKTLRKLLKDGCWGCENLVTDGDCGRCALNGERLNETPLSPRYGPEDGSCWGQRFYPHEDCKYLTEVNDEYF